ncbi:transcription termination factor Rho [Nocardioides sp. QY071]|uniref:transcription termination factor Rho n=1 Tax=Nocardioides sp. QY071 TaxID=3044187 RepID=UPI00249C3631|nr:transcription termination factor Rho [Nocardioides sp. QY071]WGY00114.1 transcription termination factor Rho [Nocardioides sp. QY071]
MTETPDSTAPAATAAPKKRTGGLNAMLLADLKAMASGMGIRGAGSMKKAALVEAIKATQAGAATQRSAPAEKPESAPKSEAPKAEAPKAEAPRTDAPKAEAPRAEKTEPRTEPKAEQPKGQQPKAEQPKAEQPKAEQPKAEQPKAEQPKAEQPKAEQQEPKAQQQKQQQGQRQQKQNQQGGQNQQKQGGQQNKQGQPQQNKQGQNQQQDQARPAAAAPGGDHDDADDDGDGEGGSRRNRRRRGRDRDRTNRAGREPDTEVREDDVLVPAAGILDVLDNYAFVRTGGYLAGPDDVYLSLSMVRKYGLRRGDAIAGQVRQPRDGERREKFNPMVRIESVNGVDPEQAKNRVEYTQLTPVSPTERLRLETGQDDLTGRLIDMAAPVGKGQRGLIVSPARAGKTTLLQSIANAITANNPECHLMVVLVDERPEEVTDFERSIKGEVIASTFDRPAIDHTTVAELAVERAKRLVELGHDVVILLDGLTRLGRAYNLAAPASGRILSGGVDSSALFPPKRFFGAARNIENGGSLTILATVVVDSGSRVDEVIFEELRGTENLELRLRSDFAEKRLFPAIDVVASGTRREELLLGKEELEIVWKLRRELADGDRAESHAALLQRLRNSRTNYEFLLRVQRD